MDVIQINLYDEAQNLIHIPYCVEKGERHDMRRVNRGDLESMSLDRAQPLIINENEDRISKEYDNPVISGDEPKSLAFVPLMVGESSTRASSLSKV